MSIFQRVGADAVQHLKEQRYITERRRDVDAAWAEFIISVINRQEEGLDDTYRYGFEDLNKQTDAFVRREAERWARSCRKYRIYEDDFESQFRATVWKSALGYDGESGTFFDYLRGSIKNAGRDLVRRAKSKKHGVNHLAKNIDDPKVQQEVMKRRQSPSAEHLALLKMTVKDMADEPSLTEQERSLFIYLRNDPEATLQEMADHLGVRDRKQASRIKERLANKLRKYL